MTQPRRRRDGVKLGDDPDLDRGTRRRKGATANAIGYDPAGYDWR